MSSKITQCFALAVMLIPAQGFSQAMMVFGGGEKAQECYMNAEIAARNLPGLSMNLLEPCDYTLEYTNLDLRDRAATFANRGIVHAALKDYEAAMSDYDTAIAIRPSAPEFYLNRGNSFFMIRDYESALDDYEVSLELGIKQLHFLHYNMGMVLERMGNDKAAENQCLQALEFDSSWDMP